MCMQASMRMSKSALLQRSCRCFNHVDSGFPQGEETISSPVVMLGVLPIEACYRLMLRCRGGGPVTVLRNAHLSDRCIFMTTKRLDVTVPSL